MTTTDADLTIRGARVLTLDDADSEHELADIVVRDGVIVSIGGDLAAETSGRVIEARGMLAMPGLVNAHLHSPGNFMKGAVANMPLELFMLYEVPPLVDTPVGGRFAYVRTMLGIMEMIRQGITTVQDDCFFIPEITTPELDNVMQAYVDAGIRARVTLDQPNVIEYTKYPFLDEILPEALRARMEHARIMSEQELLEHYESHIRKWSGRGDGRVGAA